VFFFQAEVGIRDGHVTGVQTCALPIYSSPVATPPVGLCGELRTIARARGWRLTKRSTASRSGRKWSSARSGQRTTSPPRRCTLGSEERCVGEAFTARAV